ncbi:MAG: hypothetical protein GY711_10290 [bacterium]|nr:hypothetical protein [bacterium]
MTPSAFPLACPSCGADVHRKRQPPWRYSTFSYVLFLIGGAIGYAAFWSSGTRDWRFGSMLALVSFFAFSAIRYPRVRVIRCSSCNRSHRMYSKPQRTD